MHVLHRSSLIYLWWNNYVIIRPFCHIIVVCFLWTWHSGSKLGWYRPDAGSHRADASVFLTHNVVHIQSGEGAYRRGNSLDDSRLCCVHNASTVPWTSAGQFGRPRGVRGRPWYDLWRPRCVISHPMDVRGLPPGRPPSGRPRDTQFGIDWSLLPSGCPQGVRTAEVQPITARTHYGQEVGLPTVRPKPEVDVP